MWQKKAIKKCQMETLNKEKSGYGAVPQAVFKQKTDKSHKLCRSFIKKGRRESQENCLNRQPNARVSGKQKRKPQTSSQNTAQDDRPSYIQSRQNTSGCGCVVVYLDYWYVDHQPHHFECDGSSPIPRLPDTDQTTMNLDLYQTPTRLLARNGPVNKVKFLGLISQKL